MKPLSEQDLKEFLDLLASSAPAPGGGSASALMGACGIALGTMTTNLTLGNKRYEAEWEHAESVRCQAGKTVSAFLQEMENDTSAFDRVMDAIRLPRDTEEQKAARRAAIQGATKGATLPPMSILRLCAAAIDNLSMLTGHINPNCTSDLGVGAAALEAAAKGAWLNVCINLQSIGDESFVRETYQKGRELCDHVLRIAGTIYEQTERDCLPTVSE